MTNKRPLRQALRAALVVTVVTLVTTFVLDLGGTGFYATFSCVLLLMLADFGGPPKSRFLANLLTGLAGMLLIAIGALVAPSLAVTLVVTAILTFALAYSVVLRGYIGTAFISLLLPYVVAVTTSLPLSDVPAAVLAFGGGALVSAIASVTLWPSYQTSEIRKAVGNSLTAAARLLANSQPLDDNATAQDTAARMRELVAANTTLKEAYLGRFARPGNATSRDRGLVQLVDDLNRLRVSLRWPDGAGTPATAADLALLRATQETLDACGKAMLGDGPVPVPDAILDARLAHTRHLPVLADELLASGESDTLKKLVDTSFYFRITAFLTAMIVRHTQLALGHRSKISQENLAYYPNAAIVGRIDSATNPWKILKSHLSLKSPWFRRAVQTSVGVTLAVAVVHVLHLDHGFWVVLGIVAALKLDAGGTRRTAIGAAIGTGAGFLIVAIMLMLIGGRILPLTILLPFVVFLATWGPAGKLALPLKQAGFTVLFVMLGSLASGLSLQLGALRMQDVSIGLVICLIVATLMWPHGVAAEVRTVLTQSVRTTAEYFIAAYTYITSAMQQEDLTKLKAVAESATTARIQADDAFDVAISQGGQIGIDANAWFSVASSVDQVYFVSILVCSLKHYGLAPVPVAQVADSLQSTARDLANQHAATIESNYEQAQLASGHHGSAKKHHLARHVSAADPGLLTPVVGPEHDLCDLAAEVDQTLQHCNGKAGSFDFEVADHRFTTTYSKAAISILWSQDWLLYFHWMATQAEDRTATDLPAMG